VSSSYLYAPAPGVTSIYSAPQYVPNVVQSTAPQYYVPNIVQSTAPQYVPNVSQSTAPAVVNIGSAPTVPSTTVMSVPNVNLAAPSVSVSSDTTVYNTSMAPATGICVPATSSYSPDPASSVTNPSFFYSAPQPCR
jgi:hypothetical protein